MRCDSKIVYINSMRCTSGNQLDHHPAATLSRVRPLADFAFRAGVDDALPDCGQPFQTESGELSETIPSARDDFPRTAGCLLFICDAVLNRMPSPTDYDSIVDGATHKQAREERGRCCGACGAEAAFYFIYCFARHP